jgi:hypothetical protein
VPQLLLQVSRQPLLLLQLLLQPLYVLVLLYQQGLQLLCCGTG